MIKSSWSDLYVGIPYKAQGRERDGLDCWGLVCLVHREQFDTELPSLAGNYDADTRERTAELIAAKKEGWQVATVPRAGDVALFRILGQESHVGIITRPGYFLHVRQGQTATVERLDAAAWKSRLTGIYRYVENGAMLDVTARPHPLQTMRIDAQIMPGMTLAQVAQDLRAAAGVSPDMPNTARISVNGLYVAPELWDTCVPPAGARVEYRATAQGSGSGRMLAMIAVMAVAWYAAPLILGAMGVGLAGGVGVTTALTASQMALATGMVSMGINIVGGLLINAIFPVRQPISPSSPTAMAMLQGGANSANKYGAIPVVLGRYRFTPPLGAEIYTESDSDKSYLRMVLVWGYGPLQVSDIRIGSTDISHYEEVEVETLNGWDDTEADQAHFRSLYGRDVEQQAPGIKLTMELSAAEIASNANRALLQAVVASSPALIVPAPGMTLTAEEVASNAAMEGALAALAAAPALITKYNWIERRLEGQCDKISVTLNFPSGLSAAPVEGGNAGRQGSATCSVSVQVRQVGQLSWDEVSQVVYPVTKTLGSAMYNIDDDAELEPVYRWTRFTLDSTNTIRTYTGAFTSSQYSDPAGNLLKRLQADNFGIGATFDRLPVVGLDEEKLWDVCVYGGGIAQAIDMRDSNGFGGVGIDGCSMSNSGLMVTIASGNITRSQVETLAITKNTKKAFSKKVDFNVPRGSYDVRVCRTNDDTSEFNYPSGNKGMRTHDCYYQTLTGYSNQRPILAPKPMAMTAIRIRATNQLNGNVESIMGTVISICWDFVSALDIQHEHQGGFTAYYLPANHKIATGDKVQVTGSANSLFNGTFEVTGVGFNPDIGMGNYVIVNNAATLPNTVSVGGHIWTKRPTRNPASLMRYVLQHPGNAKAVPDSKIDLVALADWHNFCRSSGFMFDHVLLNQQSLFDVLRDIAAAGRASPTLVDGKWTVVIDRPRSGIAQHFTPHNSWGFEGTRALPVLPDAFRVTFANSARGYQPDELLVYNDGFSHANARLFESLSLPGVSSEEIAYKHARFHLAQLKLRPETYTINADIEHLVCTRGDLVKVTHDVPMWGLGSARIAEQIDSTHLRLDEQFGMDGGVQYTLRIRLADGSSVTRTVAAKSADGYYDTVTLTTSVSTTQGEMGNLVLFGKLGAESVTLVVQSIEPAENMNARLTLVDYSPAIYDSDTEVLPAFESSITRPPTLMVALIVSKPIVGLIASNETVMEQPSPGAYIYNLRVSFTNPTTLPKAVSHVEGQIDFAEDTTTDWQSEAMVTLKQGSITFGNVQEGDTYRFRLRYVDAAGRTGPWTTTYTHTIVGRANPPSRVLGLTARVSGARLLLDWTDSKEIDVTRYEVRRLDAAWGVANADRVYYGGSSSCLFTPTAPGTYVFYVKARDDVGHWSALATSVSFVYAAPAAPTSATQDIIKVASGKVNLSLDWPAPATTTFAVAGYEVRLADSGWGAAGFKYRGGASICQLTSLSATASTALYIKSFDALGNYSATALAVVHDVTAPASLATATLTASRVRAAINLTLTNMPAKPADFDCYEFRIGQVRTGATAGDDAIDGVTAAAVDIWDDPDCQVVRSATPTASIDLSKFPTPRYSATGVTYRASCRMRDKSDNYSGASAKVSITITKIV